MNLTNKQSDIYLKFLDDNKKYVGLADWLVMLKTKLVSSSPPLATVNIDAHEHTLKVELSEEFLTMCETEQLNILFHELLHGRIATYNQMCREHVYILEEHLVNDLTRGYERLAKWRFEK